jgi:hypothetical protein
MRDGQAIRESYSPGRTPARSQGLAARSSSERQDSAAFWLGAFIREESPSIRTETNEILSPPRRLWRAVVGGKTRLWRFTAPRLSFRPRASWRPLSQISAASCERCWLSPGRATYRSMSHWARSVRSPPTSPRGTTTLAGARLLPSSGPSTPTYSPSLQTRAPLPSGSLSCNALHPRCLQLPSSGTGGRVSYVLRYARQRRDLPPTRRRSCSQRSTPPARNTPDPSPTSGAACSISTSVMRRATTCSSSRR